MKKYPFKFLDAYKREDGEFFFGRDEEIESLYEMIFQTDLLLVYGASGTGKTSLIQCGLASKFETYDWFSLFIRRGNNINDSFERELIEAGGVTDDSDELLDWLEQGEESGSSLPKKELTPVAKRIKAIYLRNFKPVYLIFDQFEELYILGSQLEQDLFIETIKEVLAVEQPVKIIISIREEYLGYLHEFEKKVPQLFRKKLRVEQMTLEKVKKVIKGVAASPLSNISIENGKEELLAETVFEKIKGTEKKISIELPYLQVFLDKLYMETAADEKREKEVVFSLESLSKLGDMGDILRNFLDEQVLINSKKLSLEQDKIWHILSPFVTLEGTKEPLNIKDLSEKIPDVETSVIKSTLSAFVNSRILRFTEEDGLYEVAHDSLAKQIHERRSSDEIALLEVQRLIHSQVAINEESREYFTEKQLLFIEPFLTKYLPAKTELDWINSSRNHIIEQKKLEDENKSRELIKTKRRLRAFSALLVLALVALVFAGWQYLVADSAKERAEFQEKIAIQKTVEVEQSLNKVLELQFSDLEERVVNIKAGGGDPSILFPQMREIAKGHTKRDSLFNIIDNYK